MWRLVTSPRTFSPLPALLHAPHAHALTPVSRYQCFHAFSTAFQTITPIFLLTITLTTLSGLTLSSQALAAIALTLITLLLLILAVYFIAVLPFVLLVRMVVAHVNPSKEPEKEQEFAIRCVLFLLIAVSGVVCAVMMKNEFV